MAPPVQKKQKNTTPLSNIYYKLRAIRIRPKSNPIRIQKNMFIRRARLKDNKLKGNR